MKRKIALLLICLLIFNSCIIALAENETETDTTQPHYGLIPMTEEELDAFHATLPRITDVKPNRVAMERVNSTQLLSNNPLTDEVDIAPIGEEIITVAPGEVETMSITSTEFALPTSVDITQSLTFPTIGNQGNINSCVGWSLGYYQLTNNTCLVRGKTARTLDADENNSLNVFNPLWIYSLVNGGLDEGCIYDEACAAILSYGVPTYSQCSSEDIFAWADNSSVWEDALYNKPEQISYAEMDTDDSIVQLKQILSNGYVVTIPTYYHAFEWATKTSNDRPACKSVTDDTSEMGHALTIVGYDDEMWVDINDNSVCDNGEYGAFKIANSWGLNGEHCSDGCFWLAYDAIGTQSGVNGVSSNHRAPAFTHYYLIQPKKHYGPLFIANVQITAKDRNQISVSIGISDADESEPIESLPIANCYMAFNEANKTRLCKTKERTFSGNTQLTNETVTIPFDVTPVIKKVYSESGMNYGEPVKIYVSVRDNESGDEETVLKNVSVTETATDTTIMSSDSVERTINNSTATKTVTFTPKTLVSSHNNNGGLTLTFNSNLIENTVNDKNIFIKEYRTSFSIEVSCIYGASNKIGISPKYITKPFTTDHIYTLHIGNGLLSEGKNHFDTELVVPIYFLDVYHEWTYQTNE